MILGGYHRIIIGFACYQLVKLEERWWEYRLLWDCFVMVSSKLQCKQYRTWSWFAFI